VDGQREPFTAVEFGRFKVVPHRRELIADGTPIALGNRAFDALLVLIDAGGTVLDKDELLRRVCRIVSSRRTTSRRRSPHFERRSAPTVI
jgi:DNA-binding winged helix-turn-helix (wHTH) protein